MSDRVSFQLSPRVFEFKSLANSAVATWLESLGKEYLMPPATQKEENRLLRQEIALRLVFTYGGRERPERVAILVNAILDDPKFQTFHSALREAYERRERSLFDDFDTAWSAEMRRLRTLADAHL